MKQNYTDITIILDRSGSMATIAADTMGGLNTFIKDQRETPGEATFTLVQFDDIDPYEVMVNHTNMKDVKDITNFTPRGNTPLLDAIGKGIVKTGEKLAAMAEENRPEKVIFVIITDGAENSSREYSKAQIKDLITKQTNEFKWEFVFLAANQDAIQVGAGLGVGASNSMTYAANTVAVGATFSALSNNTRSYRGGSQSTMGVTEEQRLQSMVSK